MGQVDFEKWNLEFEVPKGWKPRSQWCWINCPVSTLVPLGKVCPGLRSKFDICLIDRRATKNGV